MTPALLLAMPMGAVPLTFFTLHRVLLGAGLWTLVVHGWGESFAGGLLIQVFFTFTCQPSSGGRGGSGNQPLA